MSKSFGAGQSHRYDRLELFQAALNASFVDLVIEAQKPMLVMYSVQTYFVLYVHGLVPPRLQVILKLDGSAAGGQGRRRGSLVGSSTRSGGSY